MFTHSHDNGLGTSPGDGGIPHSNAYLYVLYIGGYLISYSFTQHITHRSRIGIP